MYCNFVKKAGSSRLVILIPSGNITRTIVSRFFKQCLPFNHRYFVASQSDKEWSSFSDMSWKQWRKIPTVSSKPTPIVQLWLTWTNPEKRVAPLIHPPSSSTTLLQKTDAPKMKNIIAVLPTKKTFQISKDAAWSILGQPHNSAPAKA